MFRKLENTIWIALAAPPLLIVIALFFYPFLSSFLMSFKKEGALTLKNYQLAYRLYSYDFIYTVGISFASLILVLFISIIVCGYLRLHSNRIVEFLFKIPIFVPFVVVGHAMRVFLAPHGILNSVLAFAGVISLQNPPSIAFSWVGITVSLAWKNMALAILLILGAFRSVNETYLEAARNFGAGGFRQVIDILLPMSKASIAVASVLMFTSMMASFSIPLMIGAGTGPQMLMIDIYYRIVYHGDYGVANAVGVISYLAAVFAAVYYIRAVSKE